VLFDPSFVSEMSVSLLLVKLQSVCLLFVCLVGVLNKSFVRCKWLLATVSSVCSKLVNESDLLIV